MNLLLITNNPSEAVNAENLGISRIFIDLELIGKKKRQEHKNTFISDHTFEDIYKVRKVIRKAKILTRLNPFWKNTRNEIDRAIEFGTDILMLPMIRKVSHLKDFVKHVDKRVEVIPLIETKESLKEINSIIDIDSIQEVFFGLNDLSIDLNKNFLFEFLADGTIEDAAKKVKAKRKKFGFGGIGKIGKDDHIPAELILSEHVRLGSSSVILSRSFRYEDSSCNKKISRHGFSQEVEKIYSIYGTLIKSSKIILDQNKVILNNKVKNYLDSRND